MLRVKVSLKPLDDLKEFQNWGTKGTEKEPQLLYKVKVEIVLLHNHKEKLWIASSVFRIVKGKNICRKVDDTTSLLHQKKVVHSKLEIKSPTNFRSRALFRVMTFCFDTRWVVFHKWPLVIRILLLFFNELYPFEFVWLNANQFDHVPCFRS